MVKKQHQTGSNGFKVEASINFRNEIEVFFDVIVVTFTVRRFNRNIFGFRLVLRFIVMKPLSVVIMPKALLENIYIYFFKNS